MLENSSGVVRQPAWAMSFIEVQACRPAAQRYRGTLVEHLSEDAFKVKYITESHHGVPNYMVITNNKFWNHRARVLAG